jgi:glycerophosphoryl diester phosphodiesterase
MKLRVLLVLVLILGQGKFARAGDTKCLGHKGDLEHAFENSMAAFISTYERGGQGIEFDLWHTRDGIAMVLHDGTLESVADSKPGKLCPLKSRVPQLDFATIRENCALKNGEDIPTLEEVFNYFHDKDFLMLAEFEDAPRPRTFRIIKNFYHAHPERIRLVGVSPWTMLLMHAKRIAPWSFWRQIKIFSTEPKYSFPVATGYDGVDVSEISDRQFRRLQRRGKEISLWTYNDKALIQKYMDLGADFITTDSLSVCLDVAARQSAFGSHSFRN